VRRFYWWLGISAVALIFGCEAKGDEPRSTRVAQALCSEDCTPYACDDWWGTCFTECRNIEFCAPGFQCNLETGVCEVPQPEPGDCSVYALDPSGDGCNLWCARDSDCTSIAYCDQSTNLCKLDLCVGKQPDDENPCTYDTCDRVTGLITHANAPNGAWCPDSSLCNGIEKCDGFGHCNIAGTPVDTSDGNPCTIDNCDPATGSVSHPSSLSDTPCNDGNPCTIGDHCNGAGSCAAGVSVPIDDGKPCTTDACNPTTGTVTHTNLPAMTPCDDGNPCNGSEKCDGGQSCVPGTPLSCGNYICDPSGCLTNCTTDSHCAAHFYCDTPSTTCLPKLGPSSACSSDAQCNTGSCFDGGCCDANALTDPLANVVIDPTRATDFVTQVQPLYTGESPAQLLGVSDAIETARVAVIRGTVLNEDGSEGVPCAKISVPAAGGLGSTRTRADGSYTIAVNGGGSVTLRVESTGYLSADRTVDTRWQSYAQATPIRLLTFGAETPVPTDSAGATLASTLVSGSDETDAQGTRAARLVLATGTQVIVHGESTPRTDVTIQVKEMTNTTVTGRDAMIASLPPTSAFTYAVNVSLKGEENKSIEVSPPVPVHIDNFLNMPTGETVPVGYYDTTQQQWVASENGRVIKIVGVNVNGEAELDTDTTEGANSPADLEELGITPAERLTLAVAPYGVGKSIWRFQTSHFSTWDCNWGWGPPGPLPKNPAPSPPPPPCGASTAVGSLIDCEGQALRESVAVAGTPFSLYYSSTRQLGGEKPLRIPLTADTLPSGLQSVKVEVNVAGKQTAQEFVLPVTNQNYDFRWDGLDAAGRMLAGAQPVSTRVGFRFDGTYRKTSGFGANGQSVTVAPGNNRFEGTLWQTWSGYIEHWNAQQAGLGGWDFDVHHGYDPLSGTLHRGDGRDEIVPSSLTAFKKLPLTPPPASLYNSLAVGPDGSVYFVEQGPVIKIKRFAPNNTVSVIAGGGSATAYPYGDGGPAASATLTQAYCLAIGRNQKLYVCESGNFGGTYGRVRVIDLAADPPKISTFAGGGTLSPPAAPTSAVPTAVRLGDPYAIGVTDDGTVFIADKGLNQIFRVRDQQLTVFATRPLGSALTAMAVGKDGSVYINNAGLNISNVLKYDISGTVTELTRYRADGQCPTSDEGPAATTCLFDPTSLAVGPDGLLYISDGVAFKVKRIGPSGNIETVLGTGTSANGPEGLAGRRTAIGIAQALAIGPDGTLYVSEFNGIDPSIRYSKPSVARSFPAVVPSADGRELYKFDSNGHHSETIDAQTGILRYAFRYNTSGYLSGISDRSLSDEGRHEMTIARTSGTDGTQIDLTAPFGQKTTLLVGTSDKMLKRATDPEGGVHKFEYFPSSGLLKQMWDPKDFAQAGTPYKFEFTNGYLSKDTDPLGNSQSLTQSPIANGWRVTRTDQLSRETTYDTKSLDPLHSASVVTGPDLLPVARTSYLDGRQSDPAPDGNKYSAHQRSPDGSSTFSLSDSDPALGLRSPVISSTVEFMGGASDVKRATARTRDRVLSNPNDLASAVQSFAETQNINSRALPDKVEYSAAQQKFITTSSAGRQTFRTIDALGRAKSFQIGSLKPTIFTYDDTTTLTGKVSSETRSDGTIELKKTYSYFAGSVAKMGGYLNTVSYLRNSVVGQSTTYSTDAFGRVLLEVTNNDTANYAWDENGNLSSVVPPNAPQHTQTYTLLDQLLAYQPPPLGSVTVDTGYTYTKDRKLESMTNPDGVTTDWTYDADAGKLTDIDQPAANAQFDYFSATETATGQAPGRLKSIAGPYGVNLSFNYLGRLTTLNKWTKSLNNALIGSVGWSYNNDFARILETVTDSAGASTAIKFGYGDADGFLTCASLNSCSPPSTDSLSVAHDGVNGLLASVNYGTLTEEYSYDNFGQLAKKTAKVGATPLLLNEFDDLGSNLAYRRDALGRILRRKQTLGTATASTFDYTYSPEGRLTDVVKDGVTYEHYDYSAQNGNRSAAITPFLSVVASEVSYDDQDRLKTYGPYQYTYTNNGSLLTKKDTRTTPAATTTYAYDALGNLLSVTPPTGSVISYIVDGQNRRIAKKVGTTTVKQWLYRDGLKPVAELDRAGTLVTVFVYGSNSITPDLVRRDGATYRLLTDHVGSVIRAINVSNANDVPFAAEYTAFGEQTVTTGSADFVPFGFAGGLYDADTGLVRFGARDYDPVVGRWTSKDPIRFDGGQANLYVYLNNDPVNGTDPSGLIGPIDLLKCLYYEWRASDALEDCQKQVQDAWSKPDLDGVCEMPGGSPHDQYIECLKNKHSDAVSGFLNSCSSTAKDAAGGFPGPAGAGSIPGRVNNFNNYFPGP